jgi:hypothetical protein
MDKFIKVKDVIYKVMNDDNIYCYVNELQYSNMELNLNNYEFDVEFMKYCKYPIYNYKVYVNKIKSDELIKYSYLEDVDEILFDLEGVYLLNGKLCYDTPDDDIDLIKQNYQMECYLIMLSSKEFKLKDNNKRIELIKEFVMNEYIYNLKIKDNEVLMKLYKPLLKYKIKPQKSKNECVVCYSNKKTSINKYNCCHSICNSCYDNWNGHNCPMCRACKVNITNSDEHKIYLNSIAC